MIIHVINLETNNSYCGKAKFGDKAITLEQAQDPDNDMSFDCEDCYSVLTESDYVPLDDLLE